MLLEYGFDKARSALDASQSHCNSSAILDQSVNHHHTEPSLGTSLRNSSSIISARFFRLRGFSSKTRQRRLSALHRSFEHSYFTPSETNLIESARQDILFRRHFSADEDCRQKLIFLGILVLTFFFPLIGLVALYGKFDTTISWYTRGQAHSLSNEQRGTLKQQLLLEAVIYPALIISLSVFYSVHK